MFSYFFKCLVINSIKLSDYVKKSFGIYSQILNHLKLFIIAPGNSVNNFYALGYNATTIQIQWDPPSLPYGNVAYKLYQWKFYNSSTATGSNALIYDGKDTIFNSPGLDENHMYFYQIIPYNIKYTLNGPKSMIFNATTHEDGKNYNYLPTVKIYIPIVLYEYIYF